MRHSCRDNLVSEIPKLPSLPSSQRGSREHHASDSPAKKLVCLTLTFRARDLPGMAEEWGELWQIHTPNRGICELPALLLAAWGLRCPAKPAGCARPPSTSWGRAGTW